MEPISIAASILTIIGALGLAVRLPDKIAALRHAPELTEALRQETLLVSHEVNEAYGLLQEAKAWSLASPDSLPVALENLNVAVAKLNSLIDRCLERQENGLMNYYRCYRSQKQLEALLGRIQRGRVALVSAKATLNLYVSREIFLRRLLSSAAIWVASYDPMSASPALRLVG